MERTFEDMMKGVPANAGDVPVKDAPLERDFYQMTGQARPAPTFLDDLAGFLRDPESWKGMGERFTHAMELPGRVMKVAAAIGPVKLSEVTTKAAIGSAAQVSDMFSGAYPRLANQVSGTGAQAVALLQGENAKIVAATGMEGIVPDELKGAYGVAFQAAGLKDTYENNPVASVMNWLTKHSDKGAAKLEESTGIPAENFTRLLSVLIDAGVAKGARDGILKDQFKSGMALPEETQSQKINTTITLPKWLGGKTLDIVAPDDIQLGIPVSKPSWTPASFTEALKNNDPSIKTAEGQQYYQNNANAIEDLLKKSAPSLGDLVVTKEGIKGIFDAAKKQDDLPVSDEAAVNSIFARAKTRAAADYGPKTPEQAVAESKTRIAERLTLEEARAKVNAEDAPPAPLTDLDNAVAKLRTGRAFDMTAEEKIALRATQTAGTKIVGEDGKPLRSGFDEKGNVDPRLLMALGLTSAAAWGALGNDQREMLGEGLIAATSMAGHGRGTPLGVLRKSIPYVFQTLERLPENAVEISRQQVTDLLRKPELQAERPVFERVLATLPEGAKVNAHDLTSGVLEETASWKLEPKETGQYADYGLDAIRTPTSAPEGRGAFGGEGPRTTLYRLPEHMQISDANHFSDSRYFGHTRSFLEYGVPHVVELQSDLAQKVKGGVPEGEARDALMKETREVHEALQAYNKSDVDFTAAAQKILGLSSNNLTTPGYLKRMLDVRAAELSTKLNATAIDSQLSPIIKNWPRRLIREELKKWAGLDAERLPYLNEEIKATERLLMEGGYGKLGKTREDITYQLESMYAERAKLETTKNPSVRFASADTVAKVEGWPQVSETDLLTAGAVAREQGTEAAKAYLTERRTPGKFNDPGHQSIYNRYAGEITRYLKGLGGKEVTDSGGHTWIEVPLASAMKQVGDSKRVNMLGQADPKLLAAIAAAGGIAAYVAQNPEDAGKLAMLGGILALKSKTDVDLVKLIKEGGEHSKAAEGELYSRNAPRTLKYLQRQYGNAGLPLEDILHDSFEAAQKNIKAGDFQGTSTFNTYLTSIAVNQVKRAFRDRKETVDIDGEGAENLLSHQDTPEKAALTKVLGERIASALGRIDPDQRAAFLAVEMEGLSYDAAAEKLGTNPKTLSSRVVRAKAALQGMLSDYRDGQTGATELPTNAVTGKLGSREGGSVSGDVLKILALISGGSALGAAAFDDKAKGAIIGGITALGGLAFRTRPVQEALMRGTTRIAEIDPTLRRGARDMELRAAKDVYVASTVINSFISPLKKLPLAQRAAIEAAHKAADPHAMAELIKGNPALVAGHAAVRKFLSGIEDQLVSFGRFKQGIPDYLPLMVKDYKGLMESMGKEVREGLEEILHKANTKTVIAEGRPLNEVEKATIINSYLLNEPSMSYLPAFAKHRRLKMTQERQAFYHDLETTLIHYAHAAVSDIARTTFFGQDVKTLKKGKQKFTNVEGSIGALTGRGIEEGRISPDGAVELQGILRARFGGGERSPSGWLQDVRNVSGTLLLGQIGSGLIQTSESLLSAYHHGIRPALEAAYTLGRKRGISADEFGLANHVIEEVIGSRPTGKVLSTVLKINLLAAFDHMGISHNLTASFLKNQRLAQTAAGQAKIVEKWGKDYGADMPQLLQELRTSSTRQRTPLVDSLLWQELSDVRPTSRIEAPELFNAHPNARLAYHLKMFMLTQADILYRDSFKKILTGDSKQVAVGLKNAALYATALALVAIPADAIKDWIAGRGLQLDKIDYVDNFIRNFGLSRYTLDSVRTGDSPGGTIAKVATGMITPPALSTGKTLLEGLTEPKKLVPFIPVGGRAFSDRYLGGNERKEISKARFDNKGLSPGAGTQLSPQALRYLADKRMEKRMKELAK